MINKYDQRPQWLIEADKVEQKPEIHIVPPVIKAVTGEFGDTHEITHVAIEFERDVDIFYARNEVGGHVAMMPVKITYKRKQI